MVKQFGVLHGSRRHVIRFSSISSSHGTRASRTDLENMELISTKVSDLRTPIAEILTSTHFRAANSLRTTV